MPRRPRTPKPAGTGGFKPRDSKGRFISPNSQPGKTQLGLVAQGLDRPWNARAAADFWGAGEDRFKSDGWEDVLINAGRTEAELVNDIHQALSTLGDDAVEWMQDNAPWREQTGDARAGLHWSFDSDGVHDAERRIDYGGPISGSIVLSHGPEIDYAVYLEFANHREWSVLGPAYDMWAPIFQSRVEEIVNGS